MNRIPRKHKGDFDEFFLKEFASAIGNNYEFHFCFVLFLMGKLDADFSTFFLQEAKHPLGKLLLLTFMFSEVTWKG